MLENSYGFTTKDVYRSRVLAFFRNDKAGFPKGKEYSQAKVIYWIARHRADQVHEQMDGLREVNFTEIRLYKVLEIEAPSRVKIMVYG